MLDSAAAIIRANGVKGIVNGLQFDLAACCRKDEFACREDVGEAYGLLTQLRHGRTSGAERPARPSRRTRPRSCSGPPGEARRHPAGAAALREVPELLLGGPDGVHHAGAQGRRLSIEPRFTGAVRWRAGRATHSGDLCFPCRCCPAVPRSRWAPAGPSRGVLGTVDSLGGSSRSRTIARPGDWGFGVCVPYPDCHVQRRRWVFPERAEWPEGQPDVPAVRRCLDADGDLFCSRVLKSAKGG
ncbi:unnamed protein product [Prorocentrum cordatum]|uniref:Uncharacterized protein n=1 Tax=Prorocentrum cordatum TaxID=2364126 RepID=A0ABN9RGH6_9DINO|nr:unnamed protein product [Polarella glacialis]